jgi:pimeloyl-ACP methyl ester carboxylesterase
LQIWEEEDIFLGKELTEGTNEFVDAPFSLKTIPNCGHWIQQEAPEEVNLAIEEFLNA